MGKYTNAQMSRMLDSLEPHLERRDVIGYAAARNTRILRDELTEYMKVRNDQLMKYGEPELDGEGQPTGAVSLKLDSPKFPEFAKEIEQFALIEHEPALFKLGYSQAIGVLSGSELLEIDWMFEDED